MNRRGFAPIFIFLIVVVAVAVAIGGGALYYAKKSSAPKQIACTQEAKQCPDGSYVGRTGPNCEFQCPSVALCEGGAACPAATSTKNIAIPPSATTTAAIDISTWKTYRNDKYGFEVKYPADLTPEFTEFSNTAPNPYGDGGKATFRIYDAMYNAPPDALGMDVRSEFREVLFGIYDFSSDNSNALQKLIDLDATNQEKNGGPKPEEIIVNSSSGIKAYKLQFGIVGPHLIALFHNDKYIFNADVVQAHEDLASQILSTFKFTDTADAIGKFCGGIAAGAFPCPEGYICKLDGTYPDSGGHCVKDNSSSTPKFTVDQLENSDWAKYHSDEDGYDIQYPKTFTVSEAAQIAVGGHLVSEIPGKDLGTIFSIPYSFSDFKSASIQIGTAASSTCDKLVGNGTDKGAKLINGRIFRLNELVDSSYVYDLYSIKNEDTCYIANLDTQDLQTRGSDYTGMIQLTEKMLETIRFSESTAHPDIDKSPLRFSCC